MTPNDGVAAESEARSSRLSCIALLLVALLHPAISNAGEAAGDRIVRFDISRQRADKALIEFAEQADVTFIFPADEARKVTANALRGDFTPQVAIARLLEGTGLQPRVQADGALTVNADHSSAEKGDTVKKRGLFASIVAALAATTTVDVRADQETETKTTTQLNEIIVTAQKREERLQDVPVPIAILNAESLVDSSQVRLQDYYQQVPGLSFALGFRGEPVVIIRGVSTDLYANPTVGITLDDVPLGSSTGLGGGNWTPDLDPNELERVEVLRGPQGTLYGASSLGGLVKFVTREPSTTEVSGRILAGTSQTRFGDDLGHTLRGSVNVPVNDGFALRAGSYLRSEPGYVDNIHTGERDVNSSDGWGGRIAALWNPNDRIAVNLSALLQRDDIDGSAEVSTSDPREFGQVAFSDTGWLDREIESYAANVSAEIGAVDLVSVTGYTSNSVSELYDFLRTFGALVMDDDRSTEKFSQELRGSGEIGSSVEWLLGGFFTNEDSFFFQDFQSADPETGQPTASLVATSFDLSFEEVALFGTLTFKFSDEFDVQVGARQGWISQSQDQVTNEVPSPRATSEASPFTYLFAPRLRLNPHLMIYARVASGYRSGGPNANIAFGAPPEVDPDTTRNYEIGIKGSVLQDRVTFDASVYHIDWKDIQITVLSDQGFSWFENGSHARSRGVEASLQANPSSGLSISIWGAYSDAVLTEDMPIGSSVFGRDGDRLPYSPRWSGSASIRQEFPLFADTTGFVGGSINYVGNRVNSFRPSSTAPEPIPIPSYIKTDLHFGVRHLSWSVNAYLNNVTDERGVISQGLIGTTSFYIPPRTIGLSLSKEF